jgi:hypothetical protein
MTLSEEKIQHLAQQLQEGELDGTALAKMFESGEITKTERRKITKINQKKKKEAANLPVELTERQKLRLAIKEKKSLPKLSKEERKRKFTQDLNDEREAEKSRHIECLGCRKKGHMLKDCPDAESNKNVAGHCFNCGSTEHALRHCPQPNDGKALKFAKCFICGGVGHISKACPENGNGLYPRGGCCHICLQKTHLVRDCPERTEEHAEQHRLKLAKEEDAALGPRIGSTVDDSGKTGGDDDDFGHLEVGGDQDSDDEEGAGGKKKKSKKSKKESANWHPGLAKKKGK